MEWNPYYAASDDSYEEFMEHYVRELTIDFRRSGGGTPLMGALRNKNPQDKVRIANLLLDDGADASLVAEGSDQINVLHVLFGLRWKYHDFQLEAPLLARLLEGGADINLKSPRFGVPMEMLASMGASDEELAPFYDVVFSRPDIDFDVVINEVGPYTLGDRLLSSGRPDLPKRARAYLDKRESDPDAG